MCEEGAALKRLSLLSALRFESSHREYNVLTAELVN
jgi:hypothetical protein